ncbi:hypothetical protein E2C01_047327 [Portunus trituberculatus]|uniref:Uncharacterized protein n=1 Tax=Portunus trituberculatus TaxID=210409 RepID=A0A5B7G7F4_PORTR|nr:hypothetical protein [Portunus trituberculatus]
MDTWLYLHHNRSQRKHNTDTGTRYLQVTPINSGASSTVPGQRDVRRLPSGATRVILVFLASVVESQNRQEPTDEGGNVFLVVFTQSFRDKCVCSFFGVILLILLLFVFLFFFV